MDNMSRWIAYGPDCDISEILVLAAGSPVASRSTSRSTSQQVPTLHVFDKDRGVMRPADSTGPFPFTCETHLKSRLLRGHLQYVRKRLMAT